MNRHCSLLDELTILITTDVIGTDVTPSVDDKTRTQQHWHWHWHWLVCPSQTRHPSRQSTQRDSCHCPRVPLLQCAPNLNVAQSTKLDPSSCLVFVLELGQHCKIARFAHLLPLQFRSAHPHPSRPHRRSKLPSGGFLASTQSLLQPHEAG